MRLLNHEAQPNTLYQQEELANTLTHCLAFLLALLGSYFLLKQAFDVGKTRTVAACIIYSLCLTATFLISAAYHISTGPRIRSILHICDHMVIYLMIAGTYTPFTVIALHGVWGWSLFAIIWILTAIGLIFKLFFTGRFNLLSTAIYVCMGWIGVIAIVPIVSVLTTNGLFWLILGGALYTLGVIFYLMESIPFSHTVWHVFVMAGALAHFICIYNYVV